MNLVTSFTSDCHAAHHTDEESQAMLSFCMFLQYSVRGWLVDLFSNHIECIVFACVASDVDGHSTRLLSAVPEFGNPAENDGFFVKHVCIVARRSLLRSLPNDCEYHCELHELQRRGIRQGAVCSILGVSPAIPSPVQP